MNKVKKPVFFIVLAVIVIFALTTILGVEYQYGDIVHTYIHGVSDINFGIDIDGGVEVTFAPEDDTDVTEDDLDEALEVMELRLADMNITDSEAYVDYDSMNIVFRFPNQNDDDDFDAEDIAEDLGATMELTFREGTDTTEDDDGNTIPAGDIILEGDDIDEAGVIAIADDTTGEYTWYVTLSMNDEGTEKFYEATSELYEDSGTISIWMDDELLSAPTVSEVIEDGEATISGDFTYETAQELADEINAGALPFDVETTGLQTISPTLGEDVLDVLLIAGLVILAAIIIYFVCAYRLYGVVASICLIGQVTGLLATLTGWFGFMESTALTLPGICGMILSVAIGVDGSILTGERIREELRKGKNINNALISGYNRALRPILDTNIAGLIIAFVLFGSFSSSDSVWATILNSTVLYFFDTTVQSGIYSFSFTLLTGLIMNLIMNLLGSRLMLMSLSEFQCFQKKSLYGGGRSVKAEEI